jgi:hypothetical protein
VLVARGFQAGLKPLLAGVENFLSDLSRHGRYLLEYTGRSFLPDSNVATDDK